MQTQATAPETSQAPAPVHAIDQEQGILNRLSSFVGNSQENDPDVGTDLEGTQVEQKPETSQEQAVEKKAETPEAPEFNEEDPLFEIEYNGDKGKETKKLSFKELREGYLAKSDYHRNIQKVKAEQAQVSEQIRRAEIKASTEYVQRLDQYKQAVQKLAGVKDLQEIEQLSRTDPAAAQQEFLRMISVNQTIQTIEAEQRQAQDKLQSEQRAALTKVIENSRQTLESDIPGWNDGTYKTVLTNMVSEYGFQGPEVANVVDARLIKVFHDAYQYRQLQKAKPGVEKKVVNLPKVLKPGSAEKPNSVAEAEAEAMSRLKKTGDWRDAARAYVARNSRKK